VFQYKCHFSSFVDSVKEKIEADPSQPIMYGYGTTWIIQMILFLSSIRYIFLITFSSLAFACIFSWLKSMKNDYYVQPNWETSFNICMYIRRQYDRTVEEWSSVFGIPTFDSIRLVFIVVPHSLNRKYNCFGQILVFIICLLTLWHH
jgi:hypothetical protein